MLHSSLISSSNNLPSPTSVMAPDSTSRVLSRHPFVFEEFMPKINLSHIFPSMKPMFFWSHVLLLVIKYELLLSIMVEIRHSFYKFLCTVYVAYVISVCAVWMCLCVFCDVCVCMPCCICLCAGACELCVLCVCYAWALFVCYVFHQTSPENIKPECVNIIVFEVEKEKDFTVTLIEFLVRKFKGR